MITQILTHSFKVEKLDYFVITQRLASSDKLIPSNQIYKTDYKAEYQFPSLYEEINCQVDQNTPVILSAHFIPCGREILGK